MALPHTLAPLPFSAGFLFLRLEKSLAVPKPTSLGSNAPNAFSNYGIDNLGMLFMAFMRPSVGQISKQLLFRVSFLF